MTLRIHTARASAPLPDDALHVSLPANDLIGGAGHRGIGYVFCPSRALRDLYRSRVDAGQDSDKFWKDCCERYIAAMRQRYSQKRNAFVELLSWEHVVLIGEEAEARRCFSSVLVYDVLVKMGAQYMGEIE